MLFLFHSYDRTTDIIELLSCQPRVKVRSCFVYKVNRDLLSIDHLCIINPIPSKKCGSGLFVCFVALRPKSTTMVMAGRSVHLTTLFPGQA